ncbi:MAG: Ig-like domain-containing protein [Propionibacteriaceae bacterium]|jgi:uncharacterized repeat protein (TIGR02543 family)|nr:Ig-like domain-containing protein [Propionibacteriaceae bacterium]
MKKIASFAAAAALALGSLVYVTSEAHADPVNVASATGILPPAIDVDVKNSWNDYTKLNDGAWNVTANNATWATWGTSKLTNWATYTWTEPGVKVSSIKVTFNTNCRTGDCGVHLPASFSLEYLNSGGSWVAVDSFAHDYPGRYDASANPTGADETLADVFGPYTATFTEVSTTALRLNVTKRQSESLGIGVTEWEVYGGLGELDPDPGPAKQYISFEDVSVRTTTGVAPTLPAAIWAITPNGPLDPAVPVTWASVSASSYAAPGSFTVTGTIGTDTAVSAKVYVAAAPSSTITAVWDASTITAAGTAPVCPGRVTATFDDDTEESVAVTWAAAAATDYDEPEDMGYVLGTVAGTAAQPVCWFFAVDPVVQNNPIVSIRFESAPGSSGYYQTAPKFTLALERGIATDKIVSAEYSLDGGTTWERYNGKTTISLEGVVEVRARATSEGGYTGNDAAQVKIDTHAPVTTGTYVVTGRTAVVDLDPSDGDNGSGVTRTLWSFGPSSSPTSQDNSMWGTYEESEKISVTLGRDGPTYVHFRSEDAAGFSEANKTITLPAVQYWVAAFNMNGHGAQITQVEVLPADQVNKPADPFEEGAVFKGWYTDSGLTTPVEWPLTLTADVTLYAKWLPLDLESAVAALAETVQRMIDDGTLDSYTDESVAAVVAALEDVNDLLADPGTSAVELDAGHSALLDALAALVPKSSAGGANEAILLGLIDTATKIPTERYTDESVAVFLAEIEDALAVLADAGRTQDDLDQALAELLDAVAGLKLHYVAQVKANVVSLNIAKKKTFQLAAFGYVTDGSTQNVASYVSSDPAVVTVDTKGKVKGIAVGAATITITSVGDGEAGVPATLTIPVNVVAKSVGPKKVTANVPAALEPGQVVPIVPVIEADAATPSKVTFKTSNKKYAVIDAAGMLRAVAPGKVKITVYAGSKKKAYTVAVAQIIPATPVISGEARVGQVLTADPGAWGPGAVDLSYQWYRSGKAVSAADGGTLPTYVLGAVDAGKTIKVKVTGTKPGYNTVSKTSKATKSVVKALFTTMPTPTISGTPVVGNVLLANAGVWEPTPDVVKYQWYRTGKAISKATQNTYTLTSADVGKEITVKVTVEKAGYFSLSSTSWRTATVTAG